MLTPSLIAIVALPLIFYLPGFLFSHAVPGAIPNDVLERYYERVVSSMLLSGWLAFVLAEIGVFSLWLLLGLLVLFCLILWVYQRRLHHSKDTVTKSYHEDTETQQESRSEAEKKGTSFPTESLWTRFVLSPLTDVVIFAIIGIIGLVLFLPPFEVILGVRDAGVYSNTGFAIARTGRIVQHDSLLQEIGTNALSPDPAIRGPAEQVMSNFLGVQHPERFIATRMRAAGFFINEGDAPKGYVTPQGFHLFPVWIAVLTSMLGVYGGLFAPGLMGLMGAWSVGMLGRRLAGRWVGILAFLFLVLNSVQVWFSRYSTSETTTQFLTFAALYWFAKYQETLVRTKHASPADNDNVGANRAAPPHCPPYALFAAALAGVAAGQFALTRIDFFLVVVPLLLYLFYRWLIHRWHRGDTMLAIGLGAMLLHTALHVAFISRAYFFDTAYARLQDYAITAYLTLPFLTPILREVYHTRTGSPFKDPMTIWRELGVVATGVGIVIALWRWHKPLLWLNTLIYQWHKTLVTITAIAIAVLGAYTYFIRPQILSSEVLAALPSCLTPHQLQHPEGACLTLQGYIGAPVAIPIPQQAPDPVSVREQNPYEYYDAGLLALLSHMVDAEDPRTATVETYRQQLLDNIRQMQTAGDTPQLQQARADLIAELDTISSDVISYSFDKLCQLNIPAPKKDDKYVIPKANLVRVGWYLSPLGVVLGIAGFALWWWRGFRHTSWLFLVVGLAGTFFYIRQTYGTSDQTYIYILRRFVPIAYPALCLGMAYALGGVTRDAPTGGGVTRDAPTGGGVTRDAPTGGGVARNAPTGGGVTRDAPTGGGVARNAPTGGGIARYIPTMLRWCAIIALILFFVWTGKPIYRHTEYRGTVTQLEDLANRFDANDILLFRGGGPTYGAFRDVPDLITTPLHFLYGLDALTIKSNEPANYAAQLTAQIAAWQQTGHRVYLVLSASGGDFALPRFGLRFVDHMTLDIPEFEQLTNQKPRNVSRLVLPMAIYEMSTIQENGEPNTHPFNSDGGNTISITANNFAAQVRGFHLLETPQADSTNNTVATTPYTWTDGNALLRLPWNPSSPPTQFSIELASGERPAHLGQAEVCLSLIPEEAPYPKIQSAPIQLPCFAIAQTNHSYTIELPTELVASIPTTSVLLHIESETWIPAEEDPRLLDQRSVGVQFSKLDMY